MNRYRTICYLMCLVTTFFLSGHAEIAVAKVTSVQPKTYVFGVFPYLPTRELEKIYAPISAEFSKRLGANVVLKTGTSYEIFRQKANNQEYDIVFVQPFDYIRLADNLGFEPLATFEDNLAAVLVVPEGSPISSLQDLRGKRIALPPEIAAVSLMLKAHLKDNGLVIGEDVQISHYMTHVSCLQQVIIDEADVCGTSRPPVLFFMNKMKVKLKEIAQTNSIPHALFAVNPKVSSEHRNILLKTILSWRNTEVGRKLLKRGRFHPFVQTSDHDYDPVRGFEKTSR